MSQAGNISQATGRQLNAERVVDEFEQTWRAKDWFKAPEQAPPPSGQPQDGQEDGGASVQPGASSDAEVDSGKPPMGKSQFGGKMRGAMKSGIQAGTKRPAAPSAPPKQMMGAT